MGQELTKWFISYSFIRLANKISFNEGLLENYDVDI